MIEPQTQANPSADHFQYPPFPRVILEAIHAGIGLGLGHAETRREYDTSNSYSLLLNPTFD